MVYEGNDSSRDDSYSGGFEFRCRDIRRHIQEFNSSNIITSDSESETQTKCASKESIDQTKTEDEELSHNNMDIDNCDKEKTEEEDDLCVLKDAFEAVTSFQGLSQYQKKLMSQNLKTLGAETRKELIDGWKELSVEELLLNVKKQTFFASLQTLAFDFTYSTRKN